MFLIYRCVEGGNSTQLDSDFFILGLHAFLDMKLNFYCSYLDTDWVTCTVTFADVGILLVE